MDTELVAAVERREAAPYSGPHPQKDELTRALAATVATGTALRAELAAEGWQATVTLPLPAASAAFYAGLGTVDAVLYFPPPDAGVVPLPAVRVCGVVYHSQLSDSGFVSPELLQYNIAHSAMVDDAALDTRVELLQRVLAREEQDEEEEKRDDGKRPQTTSEDHLDEDNNGTTHDHHNHSSPIDLVESLPRVMRLLQAMFVAPLLEPPTELDIADDAALRELWATHDPDCRCFINAAMPCSAAELQQLDPDSPEAERLFCRFADRLRQRHFHLFASSGQIMANRLQALMEWRQRTPHPHLYIPQRPRTRKEAVAWLPRKWFVPEFYNAVVKPEELDPATVAPLIRRQSADIFSFPIFTDEFCNTLSSEVAAFEASQLPKTRPNSMNNYGLVLNDIGLEWTIDALLLAVFQPLAAQLLPSCSGGLPMDHHHSFVVEYAEGSDIKLDMHTDDAEVTFNVNLRDEFEGAGLRFCGWHGRQDHRRENLEYHHVKGRAVVHAGLHRHGADELTRGHRLNLIVWCKSSVYRQTAEFRQRYAVKYLTEEEPDRRCLSRTHDADYDDWVAQLKEREGQ